MLNANVGLGNTLCEWEEDDLGEPMNFQIEGAETDDKRS